jgi:K+-transporting ATPase c subunit
LGGFISAQKSIDRLINFLRITSTNRENKSEELTMKFNTTLISNIKRYFTKAIGAMLIAGMIWQGTVLGIDSAFAAGGLNGTVTTPLLASSSMSKQVSNKMDEAKGKAESAMKDGKKSAESNMRKTKESIKSNTKKAEASVKENTKKAKNFLGL